VANALFEAALSGNVTAMIFFLKTQAGWKETTVTEQKYSREELIEMVEQELEGWPSGERNNYFTQ
jgi:hypothetical protein